MKVSELRDKSAAELKQEMKDLLREQFNLRMQKGVDQTARPHTFKKVRRDIARVKTLLNEKQNNE